MKYRVTINKSYYDISFEFDDMNQASAFAFEALEQTIDDIKVEVSVVKETAEEE